MLKCNHNESAKSLKTEIDVTICVCLNLTAGQVLIVLCKDISVPIWFEQLEWLQWHVLILPYT